MPKRHSRKSKSRKMRGGSYSSATTYGEFVDGSGQSQWDRTMVQSGAYGAIPGNAIIGSQGQNVTPASRIPNAEQLALIQKAGGKRRKGGFLGEVVNQAIPSLVLLGMQQNYKRNKRGGKTRKSRGGFIGPVVNQAIPPLALLGIQYNYGNKKRGGKTRRH